MATIHLLVKGTVQGVGFRWFVRVEARRLGLSGWVRNRQDGSVELAASGDAAVLERLRDVVSRGPAGAQVREVSMLPSDSVGDLPHPFAINR